MEADEKTTKGWTGEAESRTKNGVVSAHVSRADTGVTINVPTPVYLKRPRTGNEWVKIVGM